MRLLGPSTCQRPSPTALAPSLYKLTGYPHLSCPPHRTLHCGRPRTAVIASTGTDPNAEVDLAVFRFTLGIPGFDDALIPRVVGVAGLCLLLINHVLGAQPTPEAQLRGEALGVVLAAVSIAAPSLEQRLKASLPGKGRTKTAMDVAGSVNVFALASGMSVELQKELAWSTFALLRNSNTAGVIVSDGECICAARGCVGAAGATTTAPDSILPALSRPLQPFEGRPRNGFLLLISEQPRSLTQKERQWVFSTAAKLAAVL